MQQASLQNNDMPEHKFIPMETLDYIEPNQVKILYYQNPSRFYVYLRQKINTHAQFQVELQRAMENYQPKSSSTQYQRHGPVVAQDNHAIWHRATIIDFIPNSNEICVYFVDVGQQENISLTNIRPLPPIFIRQPAFAIPCRLYQICPRDGNEQSTWKLTDPVHDEFNRLMANSASCKVCDIKDQICYDVEIEIPKVGDLGRFLFENNLVSHIKMRTNQPQQQIPPGFSGIPSSIQQQLQRLTQTNEYYNNSANAMQQPSTRSLQKPVVQQAPSAPTSTAELSSDIQTLPPQDGNYIITQVYNAIEFYGHSQGREKELEALHKHLEAMYNNSNTNDQSLSVHLLLEGAACVIQQGDIYHRVIIKHRESESRVLVKLVDRGDEIIVDTSELLQLESKLFKIPAFAQPFRLHNYDESHSTANITRKLKRLILNKRVNINIQLPMINRFYPVEMKLSDNQSVNQILLSNDINPIIASSVKPAELPTAKFQQDLNTQRTNEDLPAPQKLLTAPPPPTNRFATNLSASNEQTSRFSRPDESQRATNGNQQSATEQTRPYGRGFGNDEQRNENGNTRGGRNFNRNNDENENENNRGGRSNFNRNNDENESNGPRSTGFNNRTGGFAERGGRGGYSDRNFDNKNETGAQRTGGFTNRGGRDGGNRNNQDENSNETPRFNNRGAFNGDRGNRTGEFRSQRDREDGGDGGRRGGFGDRGGSRGGRGGFSDRGGGRGGRDGDQGGRTGGFGDQGGRTGGFGDRGGRTGGFGDRGGRSGGFGDRNDSGFRSNSDNNDTMKTFSGWPHTKPTASQFEAGDHIIENEIPKQNFQFAISHIETPNDFYIQLYSKGDELTALTDTLQKEYKEAPELSISSMKTNQICLAKSSDACWYRATVLSSGITKAKVRFIDFGDTAEVDPKSIRQLAKKFCANSPYAYRCTLIDVEANENVDTNEIITKCTEQQFQGKIEKKSSDAKYLLRSDNFEKLMLDINAVKPKPQTTNIPCLIVYIDADKHQFYIQDDDTTMDKIRKEVENADEPFTDDIIVNTMVVSIFEDEPYRALIQSDLNENINVYFVDYGNTNTCSKTSIKKCNEQLQSYPYQAKRCQLYGIALNDLDQAFQQLTDYVESDKTEISINNQDENLFNVRLYIDGECFNEKFNTNTSVDMDDQSSSTTTTTTTTTVQEQERPVSTTVKRNNEEILSPAGNPSSASLNIKRQKSQSETQVNSTKFHQGVLTYVDKNKPFVYLQLLPESEANLDRINEFIENIIQENKHNPTYEVGDNVIGQFTEDGNHYRARIESYSSSTQNYSVNFFDYGNTDENVPKDHLFSYSNELEQIEPQAHRYSIENLTSQTWLKTVRSLMEEKLNDTIDFYYTNENKSIIHIKFDNENQIYNQPKTFTANISGTDKDCFYIHILPDADTLICEMDELLQAYSKEHKTSNAWEINDLCIVFDNEQSQYFRGKILFIDDEKYNVQCIDHGNILTDITNENLYLLTNDDLLKQLPIARQCRLYNVNEENQIRAIEDIIRDISPTECVTITVENDQNDECMSVMLFRENTEIVNDRYQTDDDIKQDTDTDKKTDMILPTSFDSAIAADDDTSTGDIIHTTTDQQLISPIGIPQAESTHQYGDATDVTVSNSSPSTASMTINQTIDFGENDPSTSNATIKEDGENENFLSN